MPEDQSAKPTWIDLNSLERNSILTSQWALTRYLNSSNNNNPISNDNLNKTTTTTIFTPNKY